MDMGQRCRVSSSALFIHAVRAIRPVMGRASPGDFRFDTPGSARKLTREAADCLPHYGAASLASGLLTTSCMRL